MRRDKLSLSVKRQIKLKEEQPTRDGRLSMLTKQRLSDLKDLIRNLVSISTDHSTLDQECL